ncbi:phage tail tip lysozyme [Asaia prunellae]|uniref:phage tail tip lysozyme n=1 Tax=Asaia prunellae TaxID=610245 RepID=UPI00047245ED|nr:phage tail tip lysozyme [Asaia prunellae]
MDPAKLKELQAEAAKIPALSRQQLENSRELYQSLTILRQESEQFTNSLVANLSPELTQVIRQFMDWEHEHPKIAAGIGGITLAVNELTQAFGGLGGILASIAGYRILKAMGGGAGAVMGASGGASAAGAIASAAGVAALPAIAGGAAVYYGMQGEKATEAEIAQSRKDADKNKDERRRYLYKSLIDAKFSRNAALGIVGNIDQESQLNPLARGDVGLFGPQAFGIGQWHKQRVREIKNRFGIDVRSASFKDQVRALILEMQSGDDAGAKQAGVLLSNPEISVEEAT